MNRRPIFFSILIALVFFVAGCAGTYKNTYVVGTTVKTFVEETHDVYDVQANQRLAKCDPSVNPNSSVETKGDMDECMGPAFKLDTQDKIVQALSIYRAVAIAFTAVMLGCEPPEISEDPSDDDQPPKVYAATCVKRTFTDKELRAWRGKLVEAAFEALRSFPEAEDKIEKLEGLLGGVL